jgi:hypothetical protein
MQTKAVKELIYSARAVLPFLSRFSPERDRLALAIAKAVKAEDKPQTQPLHYHEAKYVDGELVRECNKCGQDLMHFSHRRTEAVSAPIHQEGGKS